MRSPKLIISLLAVAVLAYIAAPFVSAWQIREAARNGDSAYLARAIDWPSLRQSLKPSLSRLALEATANPSEPTSGIWQRLTALLGTNAVDTAVDSYLTPENLPSLFALRQTYRDVVPTEDNESNAQPVTERIQRFWTRVKRARFTTPTTFEVDMLDKHNPNRMYLATFELTLSGWMLKKLSIESLNKTGRDPAPEDGASAPAKTAG